MIATSANRVAEQTDDAVNQQIQQDAEIRVAYFASHLEQIDQRLRVLDQEWDVERALETTASSLSAFGLLLGILGRRRWLLLPAVVQGFFLQHAIQGWCPPMVVLRRMGFRTQAEIEAERYALMALRGDFAGLESAEDECTAQEQADRIMRIVHGDAQRSSLDSKGSQKRKKGGGRRGKKSPGPTPVDQSSGDFGPSERGIPGPDTGPTS